jgi:hypothetical protein
VQARSLWVLRLRVQPVALLLEEATAIQASIAAVAGLGGGQAAAVPMEQRLDAVARRLSSVLLELRAGEGLHQKVKELQLEARTTAAAREAEARRAGESEPAALVRLTPAAAAQRHKQVCRSEMSHVSPT